MPAVQEGQVLREGVPEHGVERGPPVLVQRKGPRGRRRAPPPSPPERRELAVGGERDGREHGGVGERGCVEGRAERGAGAGPTGACGRGGGSASAGGHGARAGARAGPNSHPDYRDWDGDGRADDSSSGARFTAGDSHCPTCDRKRCCSWCGNYEEPAPAACAGGERARGWNVDVPAGEPAAAAVAGRREPDAGGPDTADSCTAPGDGAGGVAGGQNGEAGEVGAGGGGGGGAVACSGGERGCGCGYDD